MKQRIVAIILAGVLAFQSIATVSAQEQFVPDSMMEYDEVLEETDKDETESENSSTINDEILEDEIKAEDLEKDENGFIDVPEISIESIAVEDNVNLQTESAENETQSLDELLEGNFYTWEENGIHVRAEFPKEYSSPTDSALNVDVIEDKEPWKEQFRKDIDLAENCQHEMNFLTHVVYSLSFMPTKEGDVVESEDLSAQKIKVSFEFDEPLFADIVLDDTLVTGMQIVNQKFENKAAQSEDVNEQDDNSGLHAIEIPVKTVLAEDGGGIKTIEMTLMGLSDVVLSVVSPQSEEKESETAGIGTEETETETESAEVETETAESEMETIAEESPAQLAEIDLDDAIAAVTMSENLSGAGTEEDPYLISTESDLLYLVEQGKTEAITGYYELQNDIVLETSEWEGIGSSSYSFEGVFDGKGYEISKVRSSGTDHYAGLFASNKGTIKDLKVSGTLTNGKSYAGLLCAYNNGLIENCSTSGSVGSTSESRGGLVGYNDSKGEVRLCGSSAEVGGDAPYGGGLAGKNYGTVVYSHASGKVSGSGNNGGLIGRNNGTVRCSYASGTVSGSGSNDGGLVGYNEYGTVEYCYARGSVDGGSGGGLRGSYAGTIRYSYYNAANTGNKSGFAESLASLKKQGTYYGWDFGHVWVMGADGYPAVELRGEAGALEIRGSGEEDDPYIIEDEGQLFALAKGELLVNAKKYYKLGNDIELTADNWTAIGTESMKFNGVFDGAGYTVSGLKSRGTSFQYAGLFGYNEGTIRNLSVGGSIADHNGSYAGLLCAYNNGLIENCSTSGSVGSTSESRGGLVGYNDSKGEVRLCGSSAEVGGDAPYGGGLAGKNYGTVVYSHASGKVSGSGNNGGLIGRNNGTVRCSYASGTVSGSGSNDGGLVGYNEYGTVEYCYARGSVDGGSGGGLRGSYAGTIRYSYYNAANTGNKSGFAESLASLKKQGTYYGWDFGHVWVMGADGYPAVELRGEAGALEIRGSGEEDDPYIIEDEGQLFALAKGELLVNAKKYYKLGNDIELTADNWTAIGTESMKFNGVFDGAGYTVSGLKSKGTSFTYAGLFGYNEGTIKNLTVDGEITKGDNSYAGLLCAYNVGTISGCAAKGSVSAANIRGGLVGYNNGVIEGSKSSVTVSGSGDRAGVLVGQNGKTIITSYAEGKVNGTSYVGGLVGRNDASVENCYANVAVSGSSSIGGLVGNNYYSSAKVINCYSMGNVSSSGSSVGGLVGSNSGTVTSSYYHQLRSGCEDTGKGTPLSNAQMKDETNYEDWDFVDTWGVYGTLNSGFPFLLAIEGTFGSFDRENLDFWYSVKEIKKGYAIPGQTMKVYYNASADEQVSFAITYLDASGSAKRTRKDGIYDETNSAFACDFEVTGSIREITDITATVTNENGSQEIPFTASFWYQMPLKVEGTMNVIFNTDVAESMNMTMKVFKAGKCVYKTALDGEESLAVRALSDGEDYSVSLYGGGIEYASIKDITVTQGQSVTVDFTSIPSMASLNVEFYSNEVEVVNKGLKVVFYDKTVGKGRLLGSGTSLNYLSEGDTIGYSLSMSDDLAKKYKYDSEIYTIKLQAGENLARVELEEFHTIQMEGSIYEQDGSTVVPGVKVTAVQQFNGIHSTTISGNTGSDGSISLSGKDTKTVVTISKKGYLTETFTLEGDGLQNFEHTIARAQGRLQFALTYMKSVYADEEGGEEEYNLMPDKLQIYNDTKDAEVSDIQMNWPNLYVGIGQISSGDQLSITVEKTGYANRTLSTTVMDTGNAKVAGIIYENGGMDLGLTREDGLASGRNHVMVYDSEGNKVTYRKNIKDACRFDELTAGDYTVVAADESVAVDAYNNLEALQENESLGTQYSMTTVTVEDGLIVTSDITVPITDGRESYLDPEQSGISLNTATAMVGDTVIVRAEATFKGNVTREDSWIELELPDGVDMVEGSLTVNDEASDIKPENKMLRIPGGEDNTVVRFRTKIFNTITSPVLEFSGKALYTVEGESYVNSIGKSLLDINELTLIVPGKASSNTIVARGIADKNAEVSIYDGDVQIGSVTSNKYGSYRTEVTMTDEGGSTHYLKAVNKETGAETALEKVVVEEESVDILSFSVVHNGRTYDVASPSVEVGNLNLTMVPSAPFEFIAYFTNNEDVALVETEIELTNGNVQYVDMEYNDAMGYWHGEVTLDSSRVPSGFSISYLPLKYVYHETEETQEYDDVTSEPVEVVDYGDSDESILFVEKLTFDDADNSVLYGIENLQSNVDFAPNDKYIKSEWNGYKVYMNPSMVLLSYKGIDYSALEMYFAMEDGTYTMWQKGIGIPTGQAQQINGDYGVMTVDNWFLSGLESLGDFIFGNDEYTKDIDARIKEIREAFKKINAQTDAVKKAKEPTDIARIADKAVEYLSVIKASGSNTARTKASMYITELATYRMLGNAINTYDFVNLFIKQSYALDTFDQSEIEKFNNIFKKGANKWQEGQEELINSMKSLAFSRVCDQFSELIIKIVSDPDLKKAIEELEEEKKEYKRSGKKADSEDDQDEENATLSKKKKVSTAKTSVDPSGFVYETFEDNRIEGVTATLYYENVDRCMEIWDAEEYNQVNPQLTDNDGNYAWDVPEGLWQVVYSKEGYETAKSEKLVVPPPQLNVNIEMVSTEPAHIVQMSNLGDKVRIKFDRYVLVNTILRDSIQMICNDEVIDTEIVVDDRDIRDYKGDAVTKMICLQLKEGFFVKDQEYQIQLNKGIETYAGVPLGTYEVKYVADSEAAPVSITIPENVKVYLDGVELVSEDQIYENDRIQIIAEAPEGYHVASLTVNGENIESGAYVTVGRDDIVIAVSIKEGAVAAQYTVTFDSDGGSAVKSQIVNENGKVIKPDDPTREGYDFDGWYYLDEKYDFLNPVTSDLELKAKWIELAVEPTDVKITKIEVSGGMASVEEGTSITLSAVITPENATNKKLQWTSGDISVATVDQNGLVTVGAGTQGKTVVITAEATDGSMVKGTCTLQITGASGSNPGGSTGEQDPGGSAGEQNPGGSMDGQNTSESSDDSGIADVKVTQIKLSGISHNIAAGKKIKLTANILPGNAANQKLTWESSNPKVATVDSNGLVRVKKKSGGKSATITATATDGSGVSAKWKITSMKGVVKKISISGGTSVKAGKSLKLKASVKSTKKANKKVKWTSSNTQFATVNAKGKVKTKKAGKGKKVRITAQATDGSGKKKTVTIKIK